MKYNKFVGGQVFVTFLVVFVLLIAGCSEESQLSTSPTSPMIQAPTSSDGQAEQLTSFMANDSQVEFDLLGFFPDGIPTLGVYVFGPLWNSATNLPFNSFWVHVPIAGDYLLTYQTWLGTFHILFRKPTQGAVAIWLQGGDLLINLSITTGTITRSDVVWDDGSTQVFGMLPYAGAAAPEGFIPGQTTSIYPLELPTGLPMTFPPVTNFPMVAFCPGPMFTCYPW